MAVENGQHAVIALMLDGMTDLVRGHGDRGQRASLELVPGEAYSLGLGIVMVSLVGRLDLHVVQPDKLPP